MQISTKGNDGELQKKGNSTLYFFQGIASILVVLIHIPFPGIVGIFFDSLARIAVPLFYMISGYTLYQYIDTNRYKAKISERIKKNVRIVLVAMLAYILFDVLKCALRHESISQYLVGLVVPEKLFALLFSGIIPMNSGHILWFIYGLVYVYVILFFFMPKKKNIYRNAIISFIVMITFYIGKIICVALHIRIFGIDFSELIIYVNWIVIGLNSVTIGIALRKFIDDYPKIVKCLSRFSLYISALCIILNFLTCYIFDKMYGIYFSYTVFTLLLDFVIFFKSTEDCLSQNNYMSIIGQKHSRNVYLWHPIFVSITNYALVFLGIENTNLAVWGQPFIVIIMTIMFSSMLNLISKLMKNKVIWR